jgi:hypothetical protein
MHRYWTLKEGGIYIYHWALKVIEYSANTILKTGVEERGQPIVIADTLAIMYGPLNLTGSKCFVPTGNTIYCSIIFTNYTESSTFVKFIFSVN